MTGFARTRRVTEAGEITITLKGVNHRSLDLHFHTPADLEPYEAELRGLLKKAVSRGHIDIRLSYVPAHAAGGASLNHAMFEAYLKAFEQAQQEYGMQGTPDLSSALRIPGMLSGARDEEESPVLAQELRATMEETLQRFNSFRQREGAEIVQLMKACNAVVTNNADEIERHRGDVQGVLRARLEERLAELLHGVNLEPQRLAQETAILADRSDIAEEIGRLRVHARELDEILSGTGEMGKKLDFLLQEMNRETNTILSKTSNAGDLGLKITNLSIDIKTNIERIREQSLNLE